MPISKLHNVKNIIFDLGGVILNIDYQLTIDAFVALGIENFDQKYSQAKQIHAFDLLETGKLSYSEFRVRLQRVFNFRIADDKFDKAWNSMLLDLPKERLTCLQNMSKHYRTFLLSNTNEEHYRHYSIDFKRVYGFEDFSHILEKEYYSHLIGMRKPDVSTYNYVLNDAGLSPSETIFIDDSIQHIEGAKLAGLKTWHLQPGESILQLMDVS